jgi:hypothetical protein
MARYIDAGVLIGKLVAEKHFYPAIVARAIDDTPTADVVSTKAFEQVKWERDTAIEQLQSYGVGFCENKELAEVKYGKWLPQIVLGEKAWDCSECKTLGSPNWKRCPVCGAKMDGGKKE